MGGLVNIVLVLASIVLTLAAIAAQATAFRWLRARKFHWSVGLNLVLGDLVVAVCAGRLFTNIGAVPVEVGLPIAAILGGLFPKVDLAWMKAQANWPVLGQGKRLGFIAGRSKMAKGWADALAIEPPKEPRP